MFLPSPVVILQSSLQSPVCSLQSSVASLQSSDLGLKFSSSQVPMAPCRIPASPAPADMAEKTDDAQTGASISPLSNRQTP